MQLVRGDHFDVSKLPLIRFSAHYLAEDKLQLTIVGHHAIIDGWSLISLLIEIFQRCLAIQQSQSFPEKHLPNAMRNLVVRERKALNSAVDRGFWKQWLSSATINSFPYLASMSGAISAHKNDWPEVDLHLPLNISEQLKQLAQSLAVPLKCVLLAAHWSRIERNQLMCMGRALGQRVFLPAVPIFLLEWGARLSGKKNIFDRLCGSLQVDITKARELLEWTPPLTVDQGFVLVAKEFHP